MIMHDRACPSRKALRDGTIGLAGMVMHVLIFYEIKESLLFLGGKMWKNWIQQDF